jgi:hypothetical protein
MPRKRNQEWSRHLRDAIDEKDRDLREGRLTELTGQRRAITSAERLVWRSVIDSMKKQLARAQNGR